MNCQKAQKNLSLYLDGRLSSEEKRQMENHLQACYPCQQALSEMESLDHVLGQINVPSLDSFAYTRFQAVLKVKERKSKKIERRVAITAFSFSLVLGFILGDLTGFMQNDSSPTSQIASGPEAYWNTLNGIPESSFSELYLDVVLTSQGGRP